MDPAAFVAWAQVRKRFDDLKRAALLQVTRDRLMISVGYLLTKRGKLDRIDRLQQRYDPHRFVGD